MSFRISDRHFLDAPAGNIRLGPSGKILIPGSFGPGLTNEEGLQIGADAHVFRGPNGELLLDPPLTTVADIDWYINGITGDDVSGNGSAAAPWKTFHCLDLLRCLKIAHTIRIFVAPGTYTYFPRNLDFDFLGKADGTVGRLIFDSSDQYTKVSNIDFVAHAPVDLGPPGPHGLALGTRLECDELPLWSCNEFSNKWIYWKTGPAQGTYYPIHHCDNNGVVSFAHTWQNFDGFALGNQFNIVEPAVIISIDHPLTITGKLQPRIGDKWIEEEREEQDITPSYVFAGIKFLFAPSVVNPLFINQTSISFYFCVVHDSHKTTDNSVPINSASCFINARWGVYDTLPIPLANNKLTVPSLIPIAYDGDLSNATATGIIASDTTIEAISIKHLIEFIQGFNSIYNSICDSMWSQFCNIKIGDVIVETLGDNDIFDMWSFWQSRIMLYSIYFHKANSCLWIEDSHVGCDWVKSNGGPAGLITTDWAVFLTGFVELRKWANTADATGVLGPNQALEYDDSSGGGVVGHPWPPASSPPDSLIHLPAPIAPPLSPGPYPPLYIAGLELSRSSTSILLIDYGSARNSVNTEDIFQSTVQIQVSLNVSGVGGLDTGVKAANTWYYIYIVKNPTSGAVSGLISASATAPSLPVGYTVYRRIGVWKTNASSDWYLMRQTGSGHKRIYHWELPWTTTRVLSAGTANVFTDVSLAAWVPPISFYVHLGTYYYENFGTAGINGSRFRPDGSAESDPVWKCTSWGVLDESGQTMIQMPCSTEQKIEYMSCVPSAGTTDTTIWVVGFEDNLKYVPTS